MLRAFIEFLFVVVLAMAARAILMSVMRGIGQASANAFRQTAEEAGRRHEPTAASGETRATGTLHKDPVCGTYVPESTPFQRGEAGTVLYFCSDACRAAYSPVAR